MDKPIQDAINEQIAAELHSSYLYLAMSAHFMEQNYNGFGQWMRAQAEEELQHAMRLYEYLLDRGGHVKLGAVQAPPEEFGTPLEIFEATLAHEREVTASIHAIYELAREHKDFATEIELQWFVTEQVEEEDTTELAVEQLARAGSDVSALLMLDRQFGQREGS
ncbi:MAG: ferritin [Gemmatimonadota bacterium]|nr:ferritin [Gemmatimonadota bacterium]